MYIDTSKKKFGGRIDRLFLRLPGPTEHILAELMGLLNILYFIICLPDIPGKSYLLFFTQLKIFKLNYTFDLLLFFYSV